ncbi:unnamed protein product [Prorocentrum cordatum]|uniref:Uncharacterized protein n=1 Tax=Prorocentrum cordatum TaxID=2364126 RepID=A0ABN9V634_9DINO|nr:unnamed protein product [Polarella glacialis]
MDAPRLARGALAVGDAAILEWAAVRAAAKAGAPRRTVAAVARSAVSAAAFARASTPSCRPRRRAARQGLATIVDGLLASLALLVRRRRRTDEPERAAEGAAAASHDDNDDDSMDDGWADVGQPAAARPREATPAGAADADPGGAAGGSAEGCAESAGVAASGTAGAAAAPTGAGGAASASPAAAGAAATDAERGRLELELQRATQALGYLEGCASGADVVAALRERCRDLRALLVQLCSGGATAINQTRHWRRAKIILHSPATVMSVAQALFYNANPVDMGPQWVKIPIGGSYQYPSTTSPASPLRATPAGEWCEDPHPGYTTRDRTNLETLIKRHIHGLGARSAPPAEEVPAPRGLARDSELLQEMPQAPDTGAALAAPLTPTVDLLGQDGPLASPPEQAHPRRQKVSLLSSISFGSSVHPISYAEQCKFTSAKLRGCRDGQALDRCCWYARPCGSWCQNGADGAAGMDVPACDGAPAPTPGGRARAVRHRAGEAPRPPAPAGRMAPRAPGACSPPTAAAGRGPEPGGAAAGGGVAEWTREELEKMSLGSVIRYQQTVDPHS